MQLKIKQRFVLSVLMFLAPMGVLFYFNLEQVSTNINIAYSEMEGVKYQRPLVKMLIAVGEHELYRKLSDTDPIKWGGELEKSKNTVDEQLSELNAADKDMVSLLLLTDEHLKAEDKSHLGIRAIESKWKALEAASHAGSSDQLEIKYNSLSGDLRAAISYVSDKSNLTLDPDMDSYYVMDLASFAMPQTFDRIVTIRSFIRPLLTRNMTADEHTQAAILAAALKEADFDRIMSDLDTAFKENAINPRGSSPTLKPTLEPLKLRFKDSARLFISTINDVAAGRSVSSDQFRTNALAITASAHNLWDKSTVELEKLLELRINHYKQYRLVLILITLGALTVASVLFAYVLNGIVTPLKKLGQTMNTLASGKVDLEVPYLAKQDEIGQMAQSVEVFRKNGVEKLRLEAEAKENELKAREDRKNMLKKLASDFETSVQGIINSVASASTELCQTAEGMQRVVTNVSQQSNTATGASQQTSGNVQNVSAAVEEMSASVREIANQVAKSSALVSNTVTQTQQADRTTQELSQAVAQISGILELIQNIAAQINLLALNATIESARAGDAGRGFAVVASEVKALASQTTKATKDIARQIDNVQKASSEVVTSLKTIQESIDGINQFSGGIASAVEEQSAATRDISGNMQNAAQSVQEITANVGSITKDANQADHAAKEVLKAAQMLSQQSEMLNQQVSSFLKGIAA